MERLFHILEGTVANDDALNFAGSMITGDLGSSPWIAAA
jgi:hypothetical protein